MPYRNYAKPATTAAGAPEATTNIENVVVKHEDQPKTQTAQSNGNGENTKELPAWLTKIKEGGVKKIPKDVQKRRRNFRLKKMLTPKPPMMVLFELVPHTEIQFENFIADPVIVDAPFVPSAHGCPNTRDYKPFLPHTNTHTFLFAYTLFKGGGLNLGHETGLSNLDAGRPCLP